MGEELILQATELMHEQTQAYGRLSTACTQLTAALAESNPEQVSTLARAGETELLEMRARLLRLMFKLTTFADLRAAAPTGVPISQPVREGFSQASSQLQTAAQEYQRIGGALQRWPSMARFMLRSALNSSAFNRPHIERLTHGAEKGKHGCKFFYV